MAEVESHAVESANGSGLRKRKNNPKMKNKPREMPRVKRTKIDGRMKKLFRKRARNYNSDDEEKEEVFETVEFLEDEGEEEEEVPENVEVRVAKLDGDEGFSGDEEAGEILPGITKFSEGCRAFRLAFKSIHKKSVQHNDILGPVMSAQKKLMAEKLAQENAERLVQRQNKKEKHMIAEKGHVKPETFLGPHEKFLIGVATKGAVKLFNAVNKAQHAQKGLNPSRFKDEKAIRKLRKAAFFSELKKSQLAKTTTGQASASQGDDGPAWAPLRDNYMLTSSKLKDWDKMPERAFTDDTERALEDSSSSSDED